MSNLLTLMDYVIGYTVIVKVYIHTLYTQLHTFIHRNAYTHAYRYVLRDTHTYTWICAYIRPTHMHAYTQHTHHPLWCLYIYSLRNCHFRWDHELYRAVVWNRRYINLLNKWIHRYIMYKMHTCIHTEINTYTHVRFNSIQQIFSNCLQHSAMHLVALHYICS